MMIVVESSQSIAIQLLASGESLSGVADDYSLSWCLLQEAKELCNRIPRCRACQDSLCTSPCVAGNYNIAHECTYDVTLTVWAGAGVVCLAAARGWCYYGLLTVTCELWHVKTLKINYK